MSKLKILYRNFCLSKMDVFRKQLVQKTGRTGPGYIPVNLFLRCLYFYYPEFSCAHCDEKFRHKGKLKHHLLSHTESRDMFKCEWEGCGRLYCEKRNLDFHIRTFHKGNKFTCAVCEKQFATKVSYWFSIYKMCKY